MASPRAVIAEDEPLLREQLRRRLTEAWPELDIVVVAQDGVEALQAIRQHHPDVAFLDIQMPELTGLEVAREAKGQCHMVFITAYNQYAVDAFEQAAVDYLLKPQVAHRFAETVVRLKARLQSVSPCAGPSPVLCNSSPTHCCLAGSSPSLVSRGWHNRSRSTRGNTWT